MSETGERDLPQAVDVKRRLEMASNLYTNTTPEASVEGMHAILMAIRDELVDAKQNSSQAPPQAFAAFVGEMNADPEALPAAWGAEYIDLITDIIESLIREDNMQPSVVVDAVDEYVEETTEEIREMYDVEEGFFDAH